MNFLKFSFLIIFISLVVGLTSTLLKFLMSSGEPDKVIASNVQRKSDKVKYIIAGKTKIPVYLADTEEKRIKGLGGLTSMPQGYGMFFIFDHSDFLSIWMKDMIFPIDIIWIDEDFKIVYIEKNISPDTFPKIFTSLVKARFVLELNVGFSNVYNLNIGEKLIFKVN